MILFMDLIRMGVAAVVVIGVVFGVMAYGLLALIDGFGKIYLKLKQRV